MPNEAAQCLLKTSDWVMIITALFLGASALFVPYLAEIIKRKFFAPKLKMQFSQSNPFCHLTRRTNNSSVYYFRFRVLNEGKSQAKSCEVVLNEFWIADSSGNFNKEINFSPINLNWSGLGTQSVNINPGRDLFCDIGHISSPQFQEIEKSVFYIDNNELKFLFETPFKYFSQQDCIIPGKVKIKISVYSENARMIEGYFEISWSGKWEAKESNMFREFVIKTI